MATASEENQTRFTFGDVKSFPSVTDGKINVSAFLEATCDLITLVGKYKIIASHSILELITILCNELNWVPTYLI